MTNVNSSVIQNFLHFTITQVVPKIVADGYDNHVFLKLFSFELSHLHSSKLSFSIILPQNELIGNFATEPQRPIKATKAFQFKLFPGADHLVELKQNDYTSEPTGSQLTKFNEANEKWEAELAKAKAIKAKNDVKPEEEDMQDEMDLAVAKQQASSENEDVDF